MFYFEHLNGTLNVCRHCQCYYLSTFEYLYLEEGRPPSSSAAGCTLLSSAPFHPSLSPLMRNSPPVILSLSFVVKHNLTCHPHCQSPSASSATYCTGPQKYGAKINLGIFHQLIVSCCSNDLYLYFSLAFHDKNLIISFFPLPNTMWYITHSYCAVNPCYGVNLCYCAEIRSRQT